MPLHYVTPPAPVRLPSTQQVEDDRLPLYYSTKIFSENAPSWQPVSPVPRALPDLWRPSRLEVFEMVTMTFLSLVAALDATILIAALPNLAQYLGGSANTAFWSGTGYLLTAAVFQPIFGTLSDFFRRETLVFVVLLFFVAGACISTFAEDFETIVAGRTVQGVGGGGVFAMSLVLFTRIVPSRQRPKYWGLVQSAWAVGMIAGPVLGGALSSKEDWRWIFFLNVPPAFVAFGANTYFALFREELLEQSNPRPEQPRLLLFTTGHGRGSLQIDIVGMVLFLLGAAIFLYGLTSGGVEYQWQSWKTLSPITLGLAGMGIAVWWEISVARRPFIPVQLFNSWSAMATYCCGLLQGLILFTEAYYLPLWMESVKSYRPIDAGLYMLAITASMLPISVVAGFIMARTGRYTLFIRFGWAVTTIASGLLVLLGKHTENSVWVPILVLVGIGHGLTLGPGLFAAQSLAGEDQSEATAATALYSFGRNFGMCVGVASGGMIFQNVMSKTLEEHHLPTMIARNAAGYVLKLAQLPEFGAEKHIIVESYADGIQALMIFLTGISAVGFVLSITIREKRLDRAKWRRPLRCIK